MLSEVQKKELITSIEWSANSSDKHTKSLTINIENLCEQFDQHIKDRKEILNILIDEITDQDIIIADKGLYVRLLKRVYKELLELREKAKMDKSLGLN